jgi:HD superfamily phosphodiesterase
MEHLEVSIDKTERQWLKKLFSFIKSLFESQHLSSHDHHHHLRVWYFAKNLLRHVHNHMQLTESAIQDIMFACFFHDTGLTKTLDIKHGKESYRLLMENIHQFEGMRISYTLREAIIHHDDKKHKRAIPNDSFTVPVLVSIADDLDAYGAIGAFRYAEIYLLRNIPLHELPSRIIMNLNARFQNFQASFSRFPELVTFHEQRYMKTKTIFEKATDSFLKNLYNCLIIKKKSLYALMNMDCKDMYEMCTFVQDMKSEWKGFENDIFKNENGTRPHLFFGNT